MPLFWLTYRHSDGRAPGVVVIESHGLLHARLLDDGELRKLPPDTGQEETAGAIGATSDYGKA